MRRLAATLILGIGGLLLTPGAASAPDVPGDPTPPVVTPVITGTLGNNDWYTSNVTVSWLIVDPESVILETSGCDTKAFTAETAGTTLTCSAKSDGGTTTVSKTFKIDTTPPSANATPSRSADANGWYNQALTVTFAGSDAMSGLDSCSPPASYDGPDDPSVALSGSCQDGAGNQSGPKVFILKYDETSPSNGGGSPSRRPDENDWYNHALTVRFQGSDATSGIDACTQVTYSGPNDGNASVPGFCRDKAGNQSGSSSVQFKYDGTPPALISLTVKAGNRSALLTWDASPDTSLVEIVRKAGTQAAGVRVYRGTGQIFKDKGLKNGVPYRYSLTGYDEARNAATRVAVATPTAPLLSPEAGATVSAPPRLVWKPAGKATYYNVQVWRRGRIFSAWPTGTSVQLAHTWIYEGRHHRLTPGRYRWYVWAGYGRRAQKKFGPLLGSSSFVVAGR